MTDSAVNADWNLKSIKGRRENGKKIASERKYITVLFADLSGYTTLSERLDPEEVKDLVNHIIGEIAKVVSKHGGHIEKFAGDQVMAVFGVPLAHEDDPVRAVKTAGEIHEVVRGLSPQVQETIGQPLAVHIGINTGLAVTGEFDYAKAAHHLAGDAVNVASRLCTLAKAGRNPGRPSHLYPGGRIFSPSGPWR